MKDLLVHLNRGSHLKTGVPVLIKYQRKENKTMAREAVVSRSFETTKAEVLCMVISTAETTTITVEVAGAYDDNEKLLKAIKKVSETVDFKVVHVVSAEVQHKLYAMPEQEFLAHAYECDPETRKKIEA